METDMCESGWLIKSMTEENILMLQQMMENGFKIKYGIGQQIFWQLYNEIYQEWRSICRRLALGLNAWQKNFITKKELYMLVNFSTITIFQYQYNQYGC
ncbi:unnamed protein product [Paramecium octaurelia]|uniref:Uncharacterized protein n=1 Tax=Paramecium octaurelia TaxID=43137 RepID=A0A8S1V073_PAROT|nr:unnamed protein product [Paramecium octaurelia]